ncbi:helix-turn-helix transcriptional regulator [Sphingomonas hankyongi]|uniref:AlpA family phage regulatory protein n=1 Tax=Sphingomonas hankyongi TaxID=2908209 RepID=A0ABT0S3W2_9SPHN|nr:AlpA family phage regulatory protein [Sphingomonas hankyongi]MCL6730235.1 AlpA family phage regulatory protein [Sphingomonas hankyongi]
MLKLLRLVAVREITGLSRSSIYADPGFPKPVKIGPRAVAWVEEEIIGWVGARIQEREVI